jgi:hypothetical protein
LVHPLFIVYNRALAFQSNKLIGRKKMKQLIVDSIQCLFSLPPIQSSNFQENSDVANKPSVTNANVLTCINFRLLGQSVIPVEQWPIQLFVASIIRLSFLPSGAAPWMSEKYHWLLELFSGYFRGNEIYGVFFSIIVSVYVNCPSRIGAEGRSPSP